MEVANILTGKVLVDSRSEALHDRYELAELLGAGGSGSTYRAIPLSAKSSAKHQAPVALKILSLKHLQDWKQLELFEREAKVLSQLNHPQIPQYLDYFHIDTPDNRAFYIVQQLAPGKPLTAWVQSGWRATEAEVRDIARQLLEILQYLHQQSPPLIHRDIKPHNIIRNDDGRVFLVDFGAVQNVYQNTLLKGSTVAGTYGYMSPEQFRGAALPGSDLYGLGATVLYLLTHRSPADLPQERLKLKFRDHVNISEHFADWLEMMMEPNVADRFSTAEKALIALQRKHTFQLPRKTKKKFSWTNEAIYGITLLTLFFCYPYRHVLLLKAGIQPNDFCSSNMDIANINDYINHGGDINIKVSTSWEFSSENPRGHETNLSLIICAIKFDKVEVVQSLLDHGTDPNALDYYDHRTPLHKAVSYSSNKDIIRMLLEKGANPNLADLDGNTPLHCLAMGFLESGKCRYDQDKSSADLFDLFILYKADPSLANKHGNTVLHIVAKQDIASIYNHLIQLGWNPLQKNNIGETAQQLMMHKKPMIPKSRKLTD
jgi:serine/threonine protein kinase